MIEKMGLSDEELEGLTNEMMSAFDGTESMQDLIGNITESLRDVAGERDDDEDEEEGRTAAFPFLNRHGQHERPGGEKGRDARPPPPGRQGQGPGPRRKARSQGPHQTQISGKPLHLPDPQGRRRASWTSSIGRDRELERVIQILNRRQKNNPCLIGEPGVGKTAIAEGLAHEDRPGRGAL